MSLEPLSIDGAERCVGGFTVKLLEKRFANNSGFSCDVVTTTEICYK